MVANYRCAVGCTSDSRKRGKEKYPEMIDVQFFPFPTVKKNRALRSEWIRHVRRVDFIPNYDSRVCSKHFVDGKPTDENPTPTLFA